MKNRSQSIEVVPYNPIWPETFKHEAQHIQKVLRNNFIAVHHVGSTAIPGLAAKPKIDILAEVKKPRETIKQLKSIGYEFRGEYNIPMHYGFSKRGSLNVNLHVYERDHPEIELNLTFRNYLRSHSEIRDEYAALKLRLLEKKSSFEKNNSMFTGYNLGKNSYIHRVLKLARFQRLRFLICTHLDEWDAAKKMRQKYFFDQVSSKDPYEWTFDHKNHVHFILYKGVKIIGYAHIQLWPESRAAVRIIVVEEKSRNQGFGGQFLSWIETWLIDKGCQSIHTESSPNAVQFYRNQHFVEMPFNDPDGYESDKRDTPMGKILLLQSHGEADSKCSLTQKPNHVKSHITPDLAKKLISTQFPEYAHFNVSEVEQQGHDNRTYRIGQDMLIRMPIAESYALKVSKEQELLSKLAKHLSVPIPAPIKMGSPSADYPYPFSIYKWLEGRSANHVQLDNEALENIARQLAIFLKELQGITDVKGP